MRSVLCNLLIAFIFLTLSGSQDAHADSSSSVVFNSSHNAAAEVLFGKSEREKTLNYTPLEGTSSTRMKSAATEAPKLGNLTERTFSGLGLFCAIILVGAGIYKRFADKRGLTNTSNQIELIARRGIGQKTALLLVKIEGQKFLLSQGSENIALISEISADDRFFSTLHEMDTEEAAAILETKRKLSL